MRFHGLMVVRDEEDILAQCLTRLLEWIDAIYILDLGSMDATWDIIQSMAAGDKRIVPFQSRPYRFDDYIRGYVFEAFRSRFRDGDWVLRLDADEFYHVTPREFVSQRLLPGESLVYLGWYYFRLTSKEVEDYESGRVGTVADRARPIEERRRFFKIPDYVEPRMFQYRQSMKWPPPRPFPFNAGYAARERIPIRHYPHRDPEQMKKRYRLRAAMMKLQASAGPHWRLGDWRKDVLQFDPATSRAQEQTHESEGLSAAEGHTAGALHYWQPGTPLPAISGVKHLAPWSRRAAQRMLYPGLVRIVDNFRSPWPSTLEPGLLPPAVHEQLNNSTHHE
jgi:hypothetical protein